MAICAFIFGFWYMCVSFVVSFVCELCGIYSPLLTPVSNSFSLKYNNSFDRHDFLFFFTEFLLLFLTPST